VGLVGLAVDTAVFSLAYHFGASRALARAVSLGVATWVTWTLNRRVTFQPTGRRRGAELARYAGVALVAQGFNYLLFLTLSALIPHVPPVFLIPVCAVAATGLSYCGQRFFTFQALGPTRPPETSS
jgi:putative flippase GtrA